MEKFYQIQNKASGVGEILLYGDIGSSLQGMGAKQLADDLKTLGKVSTLEIRINSGGGSVFEGETIFNILDRFPATKIVHVDGLAASIASLIAMVGKEIIMAENASMMIHNPFIAIEGDAKVMIQMAERMEVVKEGMITTYQRKTQLSTDKISDMMDAETWMSAKEAVRLGFATKIDKPIYAQASYDLSRYKNVPDYFKQVKSELSVEQQLEELDKFNRETERILKKTKEREKRTAQQDLDNAQQGLREIQQLIKDAEDRIFKEQMDKVRFANLKK